MASVLFKSIRQISTYIRKCFRILKNFEVFKYLINKLIRNDSYHLRVPVVICLHLSDGTFESLS